MTIAPRALRTKALRSQVNRLPSSPVTWCQGAYSAGTCAVQVRPFVRVASSLAPPPHGSARQVGIRWAPSRNPGDTPTVRGSRVPFAGYCSCPLHADPLMGTPGPYLGDGRLVNALDSDMSGLPAVRHIGPAGDFPLARFVDKAVADPQLHREYARGGGSRRLLRRWQRQLCASVGFPLLPRFGLSHGFWISAYADRSRRANKPIH